ncbi:MAG: radical SAM protein [Candidatus Asgardarchaeum sp.]
MSPFLSFSYFSLPRTNNFKKVDLNEIGTKFERKKQEIYLSVNFPFCVDICDYCEKKAYPFKPRNVYRYLTRLSKQINSFTEVSNSFKVKDIIITGGSPSVLDEKDIYVIIEAINSVFDVKGQVFLDANVSDLFNYEKVEALYSAGVDYINIKTPTMSKRELETLGRYDYYPEDLTRAINNLKDAGFNEIILSTMFMFPGNSVESFEKTLNELLSLSPTFLHIRPFMLNPKSKLAYKISINKAPNIPKHRLFRKFLKKFYEVIKNFEYTITTPWTVHKKKKVKFTFNPLPITRNIDFLSLGSDSIFRLGNLLMKAPSLTEFMAEGKTFFYMYEMPKHEELILYILLQLFNGLQINRRLFRLKFADYDAFDTVTECFEKFKRRGYFIEKKEFLQLSDRGIILIGLLTYRYMKQLQKLILA